MIKLILHWLILAASILATSTFLPGFKITSFQTALLAAIALGILNVLLRPILLLLTFPINFMTLGLFTLVINGIILLLVAHLVKGISFDHFGWAILAAVVIGIVNSLASFFLKPFGA
ncbi:MAG TPA: hypothetical protein DD435_00650 [Cyanobacteria bacterium UBA8530]|nr:hypothetical protein [Cyanobacteria bacterium UBA8530]